MGLVRWEGCRQGKPSAIRELNSILSERFETSVTFAVLAVAMAVAVAMAMAMAMAVAKPWPRGVFLGVWGVSSGCFFMVFGTCLG